MIQNIEKHSNYLPSSKGQSVITVGRRFYTKGVCRGEDRVRIAITRNSALAVELSPDEAIELFQKGIDLAKAIKEAHS